MIPHPPECLVVSWLPSHRNHLALRPALALLAAFLLVTAFMFRPGWKTMRSACCINDQAASGIDPGGDTRNSPCLRAGHDTNGRGGQELTLCHLLHIASLL